MTSYDFEKLDDYEKDVVFFLKRVLPLNIRELMNKEMDTIELESYLRE